MMKACAFFLFSILVLVICLPDLEESRQDSRNAQAYLQALRIRAGELPANTLDPWGNAFITTKSDPNILQVTSLGANSSTANNGFDGDDISSLMIDPPHRQSIRRRRLQLTGTLFLAGAPWLLLCGTAIIRFCCRNNTRGAAEGYHENAHNA
jgi:hypothetical protein